MRLSWTLTRILAIASTVKIAPVSGTVTKESPKFDYPGLQFGSDRQFKITVFSDLHFAEGNWNNCADCADYDRKSAYLMSKILGWEPTDLAVINGDLLSAEAVPPESDCLQYIDRIVEPLVQRNIPWSSTYGNHDRSSTCTPRTFLNREKAFNTGGKRLAWTESSVPGNDDTVGSSNYFIPVYSSSDGRKLVMMLWFFDSRAGATFGKKTGNGKDLPLEDYVHQDVVTWFNTQKAEIEKAYDRVIPSLAFVHIPVRAALGLQDLRNKDNSNSPGISAEAIGHQANSCDATGGNCKYNGKDSSFMQALVDTEGLMAVFSGHDHRVDWCMKWSNDRPLPDTNPSNGNGINVCFGRRTGYGGYDKQYAKGARKIVIFEVALDDRTIETWNRLEDGNISGAITLNSTYGIDKYPPAPNQGKADDEPEQISSSKSTGGMTATITTTRTVTRTISRTSSHTSNSTTNPRTSFRISSYKLSTPSPDRHSALPPIKTPRKSTSITTTNRPVHSNLTMTMTRRTSNSVPTSQ